MRPKLGIFFGRIVEKVTQPMAWKARKNALKKHGKQASSWRGRTSCRVDAVAMVTSVQAAGASLPPPESPVSPPPFTPSSRSFKKACRAHPYLNNTTCRRDSSQARGGRSQIPVHYSLLLLLCCESPPHLFLPVATFLFWRCWSHDL